jgi:predicted nucleic acid-binding protein
VAGAPRRRAPVSALVIDSSAALSWCFEDEASPEADALFERVRDQGAVVPGLWHLEVANVLLQTRDAALITAAKRTGVAVPA